MNRSITALFLGLLVLQPPSSSAATSEVRSDFRRAAAELTKQAGKTLYDRMGALFDQGSALDPTQLSGWHSGRIVGSKQPDELRSGLLVKVDVDGDGEEAPLYPERHTVMQIMHGDDGAEFFDDMSRAAVKDYQDMIASDSLWQWPVRKDAEGYVYKREWLGRTRAEYRVRQVGDLLMVRSEFPNGGSAFGCYFKQVTPGLKTAAIQ